MLISTTSSFLRQVCMDPRLVPRVTTWTLAACCRLASQRIVDDCDSWLSCVRYTNTLTYLLTDLLWVHAVPHSTQTREKVTQTDWWKPDRWIVKPAEYLLRQSIRLVVVTFFNHNFVNCKATLILGIKNLPNKILYKPKWCTNIAIIK